MIKLAKRISVSAYSTLSKNMSKASTPVRDSIEAKLNTKLHPEHLQVINESFMHNVPEDAETHFKVIVVSPTFSGMSILQRHRIINEALSVELASCVHALSIVAKTPSQWNENNEVSSSPACRGGYGS